MTVCQKALKHFEKQGQQHSNDLFCSFTVSDYNALN
jgi:hypothetical protein